MAPQYPAQPVSSDANSPDLAALVASLAERVGSLERVVNSLAGTGTPAAPPPSASPPNRVLYPRVTPPPPALPTLEAAATAPPQRSFEDRLGSQIFNRIAIVAILIGATLFLKIAIDNHWIGPLGRVLVGLVAGAGLVLWSERFRREDFAAFSYSLKAIGSGLLYLSLWAALQLYYLMPSQVAFGLMVVVTLWNAWMAWAQDSELLAAYAITGAFATPLLLSTGSNQQVFLFSYVLTIDLATIALVRLKTSPDSSWSRLLLGAIFPTIAYFIAWYSRFYSGDQLASTSIFILLFFLAFGSIPFRLPSFSRQHSASDIPAAGLDQAEAISDVLLPLTNAVFASLAFYSVIKDSGNHADLPWVSLLFATIYLGAMRLPQTAAARAVHLSLAVLFLTITIPLKASGRWITIGWLAEGVALLWVSARLTENEASSGETRTSPDAVHAMLRRLGALALTLGFFGLLVLPDWLDQSTQTAVLNQRFATELAGILALTAAAWVSNRAAGPQTFQDLKPFTSFPGWFIIGAFSTIALNLIAIQAGIVEIQTFWRPTLSQGDRLEAGLQTALSISAFLMLYGAALLAVGFWKRSTFLRWQALILLSIAILKTFLYDVRSLNQGYRAVSFLLLGVLLLAVSFAYVRWTSRSASSQ